MSISTEKINVLDRTNLTVVPEGTGEKEYFVGCYTKEDWEHIHKVLLEDGTLEDNVPPGAKVCEYECGHSDTRASYICLLYTSPSPRDATLSRMPSSA